MKCRPLVLFSLLALSSVVVSHENTSPAKAAVIAQPVQQAREFGTDKAVSSMPKPSEAEAIEAAVAYLTRDRKLTVEETEFLTWGTYSEQYVYWPMKFRMRYKREGGEKLRTNDYALKVFKAADGKWQAAQYYSWRTDFQ